MTYYNYGGKPFTFQEFIEREVEELGNYDLQFINQIMRKYGVHHNDLCIWVTKDPKDALRYALPASHWHDDYSPSKIARHGLTYNDLNHFQASDGRLIEETDDGDGGFLFIIKNKRLGESQIIDINCDREIKEYIDELNHNNNLFQTYASCYGHLPGEHSDFEEYPEEEGSNSYLMIMFRTHDDYLNFVHNWVKQLKRKHPYIKIVSFDKTHNRYTPHDNGMGFYSDSVHNRDRFWNDITNFLMEVRSQMYESADDAKQAIKDYIQRKYSEIQQEPADSYDMAPAARARHARDWLVYLGMKAGKK